MRFWQIWMYRFDGQTYEPIKYEIEIMNQSNTRSKFLEFFHRNPNIVLDTKRNISFSSVSMSSLHSKRKDAGNRGHSYEHLNPYKENPKPKGVWSRLQKTPPLFFGMILLLLCLVYFMTTKSSDRPILRNNIEQKKDPIMLVNQNQNPIIESLAFDVTVMTFNLRYASASDGINSWVHRKEHLFSIINAYQPMIMGTQEGLKDQLAEIHQAIHPFYRRFGIEREVNGEYEQIFYDSRKFRFVRGDNFWLSDTPDVRHTKGWDAACVRLCTWVELEHVETHTTMYVFNTQYDHVGLSSQNESAILTWNRIQSIVPNPDVPLVVRLYYPLVSIFGNI